MADGLGKIREMVQHTKVIDHHVHAFRRGMRPVDRRAFRQLFSESYYPDILEQHVPRQVAYLWGVRELNRFWGTSGETEESLRAEVGEKAFDTYAATLIEDANIEALLIDTGLQKDQFETCEAMRTSLSCSVRPIFRIETEAAELLPEVGSAVDLRDAVCERMEQAAQGPEGIVGLKSIAAYRTGLAIERTETGDAEAAFRMARARAQHEGRVRLQEKPLIDYLIWGAMEAAGRLGLPIQFHVGHGDPDSDLRLGNPLHLRQVLEDPALRRVPVVLLHNYPYVGEAAYLSHVYPNVFGDLSLAIPQAAPLAAQVIHEFLGLGPISKLLYASDAHSLPEFHWLGARLWRKGLTEALERLVREGLLSVGQAATAAEDILQGNARRVYERL